MSSEQNPGVIQNEPIGRQPAGPIPGLLSQLATRPVGRRFARLARARREFPERPPRRMPILANQNDPAWARRGQDGQRCPVFDHVDAMGRAVFVFEFVDANGKDAPPEDFARFEYPRRVIHCGVDLAEGLDAAS